MGIERKAKNDMAQPTVMRSIMFGVNSGKNDDKAYLNIKSGASAEAPNGAE